MEKISKKINKNSLELNYVKPLVKEQKLKSYKNVFPDKKEVIDNPKIINKLYETYVDEDLNIGEKRLYKNNICLLSGKNRISNNNNNYSYNDYTKLLFNIHKKNNINHNFNIELNNNEKDIVENKEKNEIFQNIILLNINKLKDSLNNEILLENVFIKKLVDKELDNILENSNNDDIKLWDRLEQEINNEKKNY